MAVSFRILGCDDLSVLERVAEGVFDHPIEPELAREFLTDLRHHLAVAVDDGIVVGFASGVHYIHPDKPAELFVNEVGVAASHRNQGLGTRLLEILLDHARSIGCIEAWVLTDDENGAARRLYAKAGGIEAKNNSLMFLFGLRGAGDRLN